MTESLSEKIDHLYRHEYGKIVSVLTKTFGTSNLHLAEDVAQDAMLEAVNQWSYNGIPDNPVGWIYKVAKFKAINLIKREKLQKEKSEEITRALNLDKNPDDQSILFTDSEIADDQLRMIFTCCHPKVSPDSQVALTLKTLCGFSIPEIASAFLTTEENINKRLVRARKNLREANVMFEVPIGAQLNERIGSVLEVIYLLFSEGYHASSGNEVIRYELCEEAICLAEIIAAHKGVSKKSSVFALLALMSFNASRFQSRYDEVYSIIDLKHQDRSKWDQKLINKGLIYLDMATKDNEVSHYLIMATISAHHCTAENFDSTDWPGILALYDNLMEISPSPIVQLNRTVVLSRIEGAQAALLVLQKLGKEPTLSKYLPYYTACAEFQFISGEPKAAINTLQKALNLPLNKKSKHLINKMIIEYSEKL